MPGAALGLGLLVCIAATAAAASPGFSEWAQSGHSAARLVALGPPADDGPERQAGIELRLDPGYLTYWRQPGEAGLPPTIDTRASRNIAAVTVDFPAPHVFDEGGTQLFGYQGGLTLVLHVTLEDPTQPATLAVDLDYAVCAAICLPGKATMRLPMPPSTAPEAAALIASALAAVPRRETLDASGDLAVVSVEPDKAAVKPTLLVTVRSTTAASLFVEAPDGWFFEPGAPRRREDGMLVFPVTVGDRPASDQRGVIALTLTAVGASGSVEVPVAVDARALKP